MTSIVRLKRQRDEDPIENLLVTCKKFKHDGELQKTCQLTFAGTAKSENDCERILRKALQMEILDKSYTTPAETSKPLEVPKKGTKRARPADDLEVVSSVGAQNLANLFQSKRANLQTSENSENSKFRLVDVEKKSKDPTENCVYDIFYANDPNMVSASMDVISFFVHGEDIYDGESEDEETKEENQLEMNYFDDDLEEENYWSKDYPDEFNVFYEEDESDDDDEDSSSEDGDDRQTIKQQNDEMQNDYGEYMDDFVKRITKSEVVNKSRKELMKSATKMLEKCNISDD